MGTGRERQNAGKNMYLSRIGTTLIHKIYLNILKKSHITNPAVTDTFKECFVPN